MHVYRRKMGKYGNGNKSQFGNGNERAWNVKRSLAIAEIARVGGDAVQGHSKSFKVSALEVFSCYAL